MPTPNNEVFNTDAGVPVMLTDHAWSRVTDRKRGAMNARQLGLFLNELGAYVTNNNYKPDYYNQEVFFYSRHFQRGAVVALRRDFKGNHRGTVLVLVTVYPYGKSRPLKQATERVVM